MSFKASARATPGLSGAYRAVWRWHFYAGIIVMPFLLLLTLTGGLYLFKDEIDRFAYRQMLPVSVSPQTATPEQWITAAASAARGTPANVLIPASKTEAVQIRVDRAGGDPLKVFVNPYTAEVTGISPYAGFTETLKQLHSLSLFGGRAGMALNILVEIVAGWAIILCATGLYLWWPRKRHAAVLLPRETDTRRRPFWRDIHALTGFYTAGIIIFLAVTGMPWSAVWGDQFMGVMRATQLGRPAAPSTTGPWISNRSHHGPEGVGWTMEGAMLPLADGHHHMAKPSLGRVVQTARASDLTYPVTITIPRDHHTTWTVATHPRRVEGTRILYVDGTTGAVKADVGFADFGIMARGMEWGIMVHQGMQYGWVNRILMLAGCVGVWVLCITGTVMWWKRRPPGLSPLRSGAPASSSDVRKGVVLAIVTPVAILYPLTGASLLVAIIADKIVSGRVRRKQPVL